MDIRCVASVRWARCRVVPVIIGRKTGKLSDPYTFPFSSGFIESAAVTAQIIYWLDIIQLQSVIAVT